MQIFVKTYKIETIIIDVELSDIVENVKKKSKIKRVFKQKNNY